MTEQTLKSKYGDNGISACCMLVATIFFIVYSQFVLVYSSELLSKTFRPLIVVAAFIHTAKSSKVMYRNMHFYAILVTCMCALSLFLHSIDVEIATECISDILYFLMFISVTLVPWNKSEVRTLVFACYAGALVCAVIMLLCNPITDFSIAAEGEVSFLSVQMNRNKNAYAFGVGVVIGIIYLVKGRKIPKLLIAICTGVILYALLYSQCRGAFICTVCACAILAVGWVKSVKRQNAKNAFLLALFLICAAIIAYFLLKNSPVSRLTDGDSTSGRDSGIKEAWGLFVNADLFSKVFGCGYTFEERNMTQIISHLIYTSYLLKTGIIGVGLLIAMLISMAKTIKGFIPYAFFIFGLARGFFELLDYYIFIPFVLASVIYNYRLIYRDKDYVIFSRE